MFDCEKLKNNRLSGVKKRYNINTNCTQTYYYKQIKIMCPFE